MRRDGEVVKPTYQKWISQEDKLKQTELCARVDPNAPHNAISNTKLVKSLKDFQIFPDDIEAKWIQLRGNFETFVDSIVPLLINDKGNPKAYQEWRNETLERVNILINRVSK